MRATLENKRNFDVGAKVGLEEMLRAEVEHVPHHIAHIIEKRRALGLPNIES